MNASPNESTSVVARPIHLLAGGVALLAPLAVAGLVWIRWRSESWFQADYSMGVAEVLLIVALSAVVHEGLHGLGWMLFGGASWRSIRVIFTWRGLGIAAVLGSPISMGAFRAGVLVPAVVLGVGTLAAACITGSLVLLLFGAFFLFECITDAALLVATRKLRPRDLVSSHPTELGCVVGTGHRGA